MYDTIVLYQSCHNKNDSRKRANVMVSDSVRDYQGYNAFVAKKKIPEGAELVLEYVMKK